MSYKDVDCPYCNAEQDINHDDGHGYAEDELHQQECNACGKTFVFYISIIYHYDVEKADCLNGSPHDFQLTTTCPKEMSMMRCTMCDEERELTDEERKHYGIRTRKEYLDELDTEFNRKKEQSKLLAERALNDLK